MKDTQEKNETQEGSISFMFFNDDTVYTEKFVDGEIVAHYETSKT